MDREDDPTIANAESLLRRIANGASPAMITTDSIDGTRRPSSAVFKSDPDGISVYLHGVLASLGLDAGALVRSPRNAVCALRALAVRDLGLGVVRDPWPAGIEEDDPSNPRHGAHGLVTGMSSLGSSASRKCARALAQAAVIVLDPP